MYSCLCGARFEKPLVTRETAFCVDGFSNTLYLLKCPFCGLEDPYFEWIEEEDEDG